MIEAPKFTYDVSYGISFSMFLDIFKNFPPMGLSNALQVLLPNLLKQSLKHY